MAASSAAEQRPQLSLPSPEAASAETGALVNASAASAQLIDQAAARESNGLAEHAAGGKQNEPSSSTAIQLAAADNGAPMDVSQSAEELNLAVKVRHTVHCPHLRIK